MKIAFCDDDKVCRDQLEELLSRYAKDRPDNDITYMGFSYSDDIIEASAKIGGFDFYILDIVLQNDINGIELGMRLREAGHEGKIVYLTSSEEYAIDSFKVRPYNYLMKPIDEKNLFRITDEIYDLVLHESRSNILVKSKESSVLIKYDSILYAELVKRAAVYYLAGGKKIESTTLRTSFSEAVSELIRDERFVLCGSGMLINLHHVKSVETDSVVFRNGTKLYLGRKLCKDLRAEWNRFWFEKAGV